MKKRGCSGPSLLGESTWDCEQNQKARGTSRGRQHTCSTWDTHTHARVPTETLATPAMGWQSPFLQRSHRTGCYTQACGLGTTARGICCHLFPPPWEMHALSGMLQPAQSIMHQKPPALRLSVPSLLCHTPPDKEFPALQATHGHRRLCLSLSSVYRFLGLFGLPSSIPGSAMGCSAGRAQGCAKPLPSPALRAQTCYPRNHLQCSAEGNPVSSLFPSISKDAMEAEALPGHHPAPGEEFVLMQSSLEMRPCCTCQQL